MKKQKVTTQKPKLTYRVNEQIRVPEVRIIFPDGTQEVMKTIDAKRVAEERNQDLIEVQPNAEPPVCKFDNLGRLLYKMDKRDKDLKKKQTTQTPHLSGTRSHKSPGAVLPRPRHCHAIAGHNGSFRRGGIRN